MKKTILKIALLFFVLFVVVLVVIYNLLGSIVRTGVETIGPEATGTKVTLADVDIGLFEARVGLDGFVIGNPEGFTSESAFKLGKMVVDVDAGTVTNDVIIVESILIDGSEITWEGWAGDNHKKIMKNIEKYSGRGKEGEEKAEPKEAGGPEKKVIIEDFKFQNSSISFVMGGKKIAKIKFPDLHLTEMGRKQGGQTLEEALQQAYKQIFASLQNSVTQNHETLKKMVAEFQTKGKEMLQKGKESLEIGKEAIQKGDLTKVKEKALEGAKGIEEGIGGLFDKK